MNMVSYSIDNAERINLFDMKNIIGTKIIEASFTYDLFGSDNISFTLLKPYKEPEKIVDVISLRLMMNSKDVDKYLAEYQLCINKENYIVPLTFKDYEGDIKKLLESDEFKLYMELIKL